MIDSRDVVIDDREWFGAAIVQRFEQDGYTKLRITDLANSSKTSPDYAPHTFDTRSHWMPPFEAGSTAGV